MQGRQEMKALKREMPLRPRNIEFVRGADGRVYAIVKNAIKAESKKVYAKAYEKPNPKKSYTKRFFNQFSQIRKSVPQQQPQQIRQIQPQQLQSQQIQPQPQPRTWNPFEHKDIEEFYPDDNFSDGVYLKFFDLSNKRGGGRTGECFGI